MKIKKINRIKSTEPDFGFFEWAKTNKKAAREILLNNLELFHSYIQNVELVQKEKCSYCGKKSNIRFSVVIYPLPPCMENNAIGGTCVNCGTLVRLLVLRKNQKKA